MTVMIRMIMIITVIIMMIMIIIMMIRMITIMTVIIMMIMIMTVMMIMIMRVMTLMILMQDNITWTCSRAHEVYDWRFDENVVSYLPLSHVAGTFIDIYLIMYGGGSVYFADKMALQGTLLKTLVEAKPTLFFGVPR